MEETSGRARDERSLSQDRTELQIARDVSIKE